MTPPISLSASLRWLTCVVIALAGSVVKADAPTPLSCTVGPVTKSYGNSEWLVYGCDDGRSVVVISSPGSAATPFVFFVVYGRVGLELHGEGNGNKAATDAAYASLKALTDDDVAKLYAEAKAVASSAK
jgi:hypothetical protein